MTYYKRIDTPDVYGMVLERTGTGYNSRNARFRVLEVDTNIRHSVKIVYNNWIFPDLTMFAPITKEEFEAAFKQCVYELVDVVDAGGVDVL